MITYKPSSLKYILILGYVTTSLLHLDNPPGHTFCQGYQETLWDVFPNFSNCQNTLVSCAAILQLQPFLDDAPQVLDRVEVGRVPTR